MGFNPEYRHLGRFMGDPTPSAAEVELTRTMAASALVGKLEAIVSSGVLSEADEADARVILVKAYRAFGILSVAERST